MAKKNFKQFISQYIIISIVIISLLFTGVFGVIVRNLLIRTSKHSVNDKIKQSEHEIQQQIAVDLSEITILSEIVASQINTPKAFYDFNSLFSFILSSQKSINSIFIILSPNSVTLDESLYPLLDSLGRYNVKWSKNPDNIITLDSISANKNKFYYETVKNSGKLEVFSSGFNNNYLYSKFLKTIVLPIYEGTHFIGVIGYSFSFNFIESIMRQNDLDNTAFIADEGGIIVFDRNKKTSISQEITKITNINYKQHEIDIIRNNDFDARNNNEILFFRSFKPKPLNVEWKIGVIAQTKDIFQEANFYFYLIISISIVILILAILLSNTIMKRTVESISNIVKNTKNITEGKLQNEIISITNFKEIDNITTNLLTLRKRLLKLTLIYDQIQNQNITDKLKSYGKDDELAESINTTLDTIIQQTQKQKKEIIIKERNEWINKGLSILHDASRIDQESIEILTDNINQKIVPFVDAFLSTFFIYFNENEKKYLKSISTFGLDKKRGYSNVINMGDGVIGSVALEGKRQYFETVSDDYHIVIAGLSEMKPKSILVQPLIYDNQFYGIIEIAFLRKLQNHELLFFEKASTEIALSIRNIHSSVKTDELIEKMENRTNEIQKIKTLLDTKIKELNKKEKDISYKETTIKNTLKAINNTLMTLETTIDGVLLSANNKYLETMNYSFDQLKGINILSLVRDEKAELEQIIKKVSEGKIIEKTVKRYTRYGEIKWLDTTFTPYTDANGRITKIIFYASDITKHHKTILKLEKDIRMLKKQLKLLKEHN